MTREQSLLAHGTDAEISSLIATLHASGERLEELTRGEVDTVADSEGRTYLLRRAQDLLRHSDAAKQAAILNALPVHVALLDSQGVIVSVNDAWRRFGHPNSIPGPGYETGGNYLDICDGRQGEGSVQAHQVAAGIRSVLASTSKSFSIEYSANSHTGQHRFRTTVTPLADNYPAGAVVMHVDATAEWQATESLRVSELRFRQMAENIREVFWLTDPAKNQILYVSPAYEEVWGRTCKSVYASPRDWVEAIHPEDRERVLRAVKSQASGMYAEEYRIVRPDGAIRWIRDRAFPVFRNEREVYRIAGLAEDITEQRRAKDELRESERRFSDMLDNVELISVMIDRKACITYCNDYLLRLTGWRREEVIGRNWLEVFIPPELDEMKATFSALLSGARYATHHENEILTRSGGRRLIQWNNTLLRSASGEVIGTASIGEDVTVRTRAEDEVRRLNFDLERRVVERTAELQAANTELEAFDYSISHDLRAPLTRIEGFGSMLREQYGDKLDARGRDLLQRIVDAARGMDALVGDLFTLSTVTRGELQRGIVDMSALAESIVASLRRSEPGRAVTFEAAAGLSARADPGLLRSVLENLLGNAWKFTGQRSDPRIEFGCLQAGDERAFFVRDNGAGFDSANATKLFTPFQRMHSAKEFAGTGIGLATVQRIVHRHGGRVWAESAAGEGATFFFTLSA
jgi:PAS domain S-box-containing protein